MFGDYNDALTLASRLVFSICPDSFTDLSQQPINRYTTCKLVLYVGGSQRNFESFDRVRYLAAMYTHRVINARTSGCAWKYGSALGTACILQPQF